MYTSQGRGFIHSDRTIESSDKATFWRILFLLENGRTLHENFWPFLELFTAWQCKYIGLFLSDVMDTTTSPGRTCLLGSFKLGTPPATPTRNTCSTLLNIPATVTLNYSWFNRTECKCSYVINILFVTLFCINVLYVVMHVLFQ